ncbi:Transcriptional regulatory protein LiaR [Actinomadura rubteroloni]|uniref:Transcriptional regulatory protein LiaR n=1 Tax=Actinomadura rubteroloni TaxID=1926885 RepID=A0A2P4URU9_9ACTN|nr:response regulator transcription factor [Actinomadura rubteroloni]POM27783.1 Transcriptional regulatory protein LiaR [Actinomadura rubteroloni]
MTAPIRVVIADDDALVRLGLTTMLDGLPDITVVAEAADGAEAAALAAEHAPDVILMDLRMPVLDGVAATAEIRRRPAPPAIIMLTTFDADENVLAALRAGAGGFIVKHTPPAEIVTAIRRAASGEPVLSPSALRSLIDQLTAPSRQSERQQARDALDRLTDSERAVAAIVARGRTNAEIAAELYMSIASVKLHIARMLTKLNVDNRTQLALLVHDAR